MNRTNPVRGVFYLLKTGVVAQALNFLSVVLVMRKYDPQSFGVFTLIISLAALMGALSSLRIERALVVEPAARVARLLLLCFALVFASTVLCFLILGSALAVQGMSASIFSLPAALGAFYCLFVGTNQVLSHVAIRDQRLTLVGISDLSFASVLVMLIWELDPGNEGSTTLLAIYVVAQLGALASYLRLDLRKWRRADSEPTSLRELVKYVSSVLTALIANVEFRGIYYLAGLYFGSAATGSIALAHRIMYAPINLIGNAMRRAYFREFARSDDRELICLHVRRVLIYGSLASVAILPIVRLLIDQLGFFVPEKWAESVDYMLILYPTASILVLLSWLDRVYDAHGKQFLALRYEIVYVTVLYLVLALMLFDANPRSILIAYTLITVTYNVVWAALTLRMLGVAQSTTVALGVCHGISCAQIIFF